MILRFLSAPESARLGEWVRESRKLVEEDRPSYMPSGNIVVGPWVVDPAARRVHLGIHRADLNASFVKEGDRYVI